MATVVGARKFSVPKEASQTGLKNRKAPHTKKPHTIREGQVEILQQQNALVEDVKGLTEKQEGAVELLQDFIEEQREALQTLVKTLEATHEKNIKQINAGNQKIITALIGIVVKVLNDERRRSHKRDRKDEDKRLQDNTGMRFGLGSTTIGVILVGGIVLGVVGPSGPLVTSILGIGGVTLSFTTGAGKVFWRRIRSFFGCCKAECLSLGEDPELEKPVELLGINVEELLKLAMKEMAMKEIESNDQGLVPGVILGSDKKSENEPKSASSASGDSTMVMIHSQDTPQGVSGSADSPTTAIPFSTELNTLERALSPARHAIPATVEPEKPPVVFLSNLAQTGSPTSGVAVSALQASRRATLSAKSS